MGGQLAYHCGHSSNRRKFVLHLPISGDARKEFECYKVALSFASPYFDAMLTANMTENNANRIEFPTKDPKEWEMFYPFVDPSQIGEAAPVDTIHDGNAMKLVPWFQEFQMDGYFAKCDNFLTDKVLTLARANRPFWGIEPQESFWVWDRDTAAPNNKKRKESFEGIMKLLQFSCVYDLNETKRYAERVILKLANSQMLVGTHDLFDLSTVKELTELFLPLAEEEERKGKIKIKHFVSRGKSPVLWNIIVKENFDDQLNGLSLEEINNNPLLPMLIKTFLESTAAQESRHNISESTKEIIQDVVRYPGELYDTMDTSDTDAAVKEYLVDMIKNTAKSHNKTFQNLDITLPDFRSD